MVSFQYVPPNPCTDVVKKPKLDNHHGRCRTSFTCIDCSTTFTGPAQWKGHTTCITEAEKYQKSLYKGPKKGQGPQPGSRHQENARSHITNAAGKYHQSRNTQSGWGHPQYVRNCASGANTTPLGTPRRISPVDTSAAGPSPSISIAPAKPEPRKSNKRHSEAVAEVHGTEPKAKKKKRHDTSREHDREGVATDETANTDSKQLENALSNVHDPSLEDKKGRDNSQAEAQAPNEDTTPKTLRARRKLGNEKGRRMGKPQTRTRRRTRSGKTRRKRKEGRKE
ncbi:hypothetical protein BGW80DRAFT_1282305 [Lactifluus volemus]|nr:hypothetical protein BGW80DRAFT_1282305 [Lactifluus volemus]